MKQISSIIIIILVIIFSSCSKGGGKKVVVMASGEVQVNGNTITLQPGTTHNEIIFVPDGDSIIVNSPSGNMGFSVKEDGLYLLNLKKDTLIGSYQRTGTDNSQQVISQENIWQRVDSLNQLMAGKNVSEAAKNYNIPPFTIARITRNTDAQIIGPYRKLPASFDPSQEHEVYKFYTTKEIMEIISKVKKMLAN
jgi:hypothetical protein